MLLLVIAAALALGLGVVGLYGVITSLVAGRTREIGIRMALGADHREVWRMVVREGLALSLVGLGLGTAGALAATRVMTSLLFGVSANDPVTYLAVASLVLLVATLASYLPARRGAAMHALDALRHGGG